VTVRAEAEEAERNPFNLAECGILEIEQRGGVTVRAEAEEAERNPFNLAEVVVKSLCGFFDREFRL